MIQNLRDYVAEGEDADKILASLGSRFLNFKADSRSIIHSQRYSWQSLGGYNNGYDAIFRHFTGNNMDREKFGFTVGSTEYILWTWRGDYLNLGAGAEIGFYQRPSAMAQDPNGLDHYFVWPNSAIPMQLYLYNYNGSSNITNIFSWRPTETQWWITGFNPEYVDNVNVNTQVMVGCVDFSKYTDVNGENEMYDKFKEYNEINIELMAFLVFDDDNKQFGSRGAKGAFYEKTLSCNSCPIIRPISLRM